MLTIITDQNDDSVRIALRGELDLTTERMVDQAVRLWLRAERIEVDCSGLLFCDSTGVAALVRARNKAESAGISLYLSHVHGLVERVMDVSGVLRLLTSR